MITRTDLMEYLQEINAMQSAARRKLTRIQCSGNTKKKLREAFVRKEMILKELLSLIEITTL